jgi:hypothetical protein
MPERNELGLDPPLGEVGLVRLAHHRQHRDDRLAAETAQVPSVGVLIVDAAISQDDLGHLAQGEPLGRETRRRRHRKPFRMPHHDVRTLLGRECRDPAEQPLEPARIASDEQDRARGELGLVLTRDAGIEAEASHDRRRDLGARDLDVLADEHVHRTPLQSLCHRRVLRRGPRREHASTLAATEKAGMTPSHSRVIRARAKHAWR